jgi:myosin heavy subunit
MQSVGIDEQERVNIMATVATVLHIGNLAFVPSDQMDDGSELAMSDPVVQEAADNISRLCGVEQEALVSALCSRQVMIGGECISKPVSMEDAENKRDALAKALYALLFRWLVRKLNERINGREQNNVSFIGVLDIYGFENFDTNR